MKRKHILILAAAVLVDLAFLLWFFAPRTPPPHLPEASPAPLFRATSLPVQTGAAASPSASDPLAGNAAGSPLAADLNAPGGDALRDVRTLHALLRLYLRALHSRAGPPIGDDIDLARVLTGHNPMHFIVIPPGHPALSADGHLRDRWGTPYFIHPIGYGAFEIRSAGPDRKMFTADDLVDGPAGTQHTEISDEASAQ